jgi:phosphatidylserine/phosphatidylglycerophosphate/cardiolipin synthase-like enzyme
VNIIFSISSGKNILVFNNQAGGGHRSAVEAISEQILNNGSNVITKDIFTDVLGENISSPLYEFWNEAMKSENLARLNFPLKMQPVGEFFLGLPIMINASKWLLENKISAVINPQPAGLHALAKSVRIANQINKYILNNNEEIFIYNVLTELPTHQTTDFFDTYLRLNDEDRRICKLISTRPLLSLEKNNSESEFWKQHTGFDLIDVVYDEFPIRKPFIEYSAVDPKQIKELEIQIKNEKAQQILNEICILPQKIVIGKNSIEIDENDCVSSIMLGSQSSTESTLKYTNDLINFYREVQSKNKQFIFIFCGDYRSNGKFKCLFSRICDLVKFYKETHQFPDNLYVIPLENQKAQEVALFFRRSNMTFTRSGGLTAMELYKVATGQLYIHSSHEDPAQGMPEWEVGNARYLEQTKGAQIITTNTHPFLPVDKEGCLNLNNTCGFGIESFLNKGPRLGKQSFADLRIISHTPETFAWKKKLIETAERSVELSPNFAGGKGFRELLKVIENRMQERPELIVHLLCADGVLESEDKDYLAFLSKNPNFHYLITDLQFNPFNFSVEENHVKLLVVDEKYFVLGGSSITEAQRREVLPNIDEESGFINKYLPGAYRDTDVIGLGIVAQRMRVEFFKLYSIWENRMKGIHAERYFPVEEGNGGVCAEFHDPQGLSTKVNVRFFVGGPEHGNNNPITHAHLNLIHSASKSIRIANSQFNPDEKVLQALAEKKANGAFIVGQFNHEIQKTLLTYPSRPNYWVLNKAFEYNNGPTLFHNKLMVADDQRVLIGSYNQSQKSAFCDYEIALEIDDENCARQVVEALNKDIDFSVEYDLNTDDIFRNIETISGKVLGLFTTKLT